MKRLTATPALSTLPTSTDVALSMKRPPRSSVTVIISCAAVLSSSLTAINGTALPPSLMVRLF